MKYILLLIIGLLWLLPQRGFAERQILDQVIAVVNDEAITQSELDALLRPIYQQYKEELQGERLMRAVNEARTKLMNQLIEDRLVFQEAKELGVTINQAEIERQLAQFKQRFQNESELEEALRNEGLSLNDMRERIRRQAMVRRLHDMEVRSKIVVSPMEISDFYEKNQESFASERSLRVRSITIKKTAESREQGLKDEVAFDEITDLRKRILRGEDFGKIAEEYSEDTNAKSEGLGPWIQQGEMIPEINDVIFAMKVHEISEIIETEIGYHLFRVEETKEAFKKTLEESRDQIYSKLFYDKAQKRFQEWTEDLKRKSYISIR